MKTLARLLLTVALVAAAPARAWIPMKIPFTARLADSGTAMTGTVTLSFKVYDNASGGNLLWSETQTPTATDGVVTVLLGDVTSITDGVFADFTYLEVAVGGTTMSPRIPLVAVPYAIHAGRAEALVSADQNILITPEDISTPGTPNEIGNKLEWSKLKNAPAYVVSGQAGCATTLGAGVTVTAGNSGQATATCPAGKLAWGGGYDIAGTSTAKNFFVLSSHPVGNGDVWSVWVNNQDTQSITVTSVAVCCWLH